MTRKQYNALIKEAAAMGKKATSMHGGENAEFLTFIEETAVEASKFSPSYTQYAYIAHETAWIVAQVENRTK